MMRQTTVVMRLLRDVAGMALIVGLGMLVLFVGGVWSTAKEADDLQMRIEHKQQQLETHQRLVPLYARIQERQKRLNAIAVQGKNRGIISAAELDAVEAKLTELAQALGLEWMAGESRIRLEAPDRARIPITVQGPITGLHAYLVAIAELPLVYELGYFSIHVVGEQRQLQLTLILPLE